MNLTKPEINTLKWLLQEAKSVRGYYTGGPELSLFDEQIETAELIIKKLIVKKPKRKAKVQ